MLFKLRIDQLLLKEIDQRTENISKDYTLIDSFIIYLCLEGEFLIRWEGNSEAVIRGECVLLPAMIKEVDLEPAPEAKLLEIFINDDINKNKPK